jgi:hypothetical protein
MFFALHLELVKKIHKTTSEYCLAKGSARVLSWLIIICVVWIGYLV